MRCNDAPRLGPRHDRQGGTRSGAGDRRTTLAALEGGRYPKSSSDDINARKQGGVLDVNQNSNVKVYSSSYPFGVRCADWRGGIVMHHTDPAFHGVVVAPTIIIFVCGLIVVTNFFITLSR